VTTSPKGRALIESAEGLRLDAYLDGRGIPTIGYGHAIGVKMGDSCTQEMADAWLAADLKTAENCITHMAKVPINQNQFDALVSLAYNIGCGNFGKSSVLRALNDGQIQSAAQAFLMWNKIGGEVSQGLTNRREAERSLFLESA
jgi:lysozyme